MPARIYREKALCLSKAFISHALTNEVGAVNDIVDWLYLSPVGPKLLKEAVNDAVELLSRRKEGTTAYEKGKEPLSTGAEILLKRQLPLLEEKLMGLGRSFREVI